MYLYVYQVISVLNLKSIFITSTDNSEVKFKKEQFVFHTIFPRLYSPLLFWSFPRASPAADGSAWSFCMECEYFSRPPGPR